MKNRNRSIRVFFVFVLWFHFQSVLIPASGQTTAISGVVNSYYRVLEIIPAKACIRLSSTAGLTVNDPILLIQMKGATITTTNNSSFGTVTALNDAGNYETGTICSIIGDSVFLFHILENTYTPATGKVQLVPFARYVSANVTDTVKATPWNNSTGTGGVIAIYTEQDLILNAPVYAGASGYRGGNFQQSNGTCSDALPASGYAYNASNLSPQSGAAKGEGIADVASNQTGGRGAPANGGGGGNNHNNSGGGGANLNAGGTGGGNSSSGVACTATLKGEAGRSLSSNSGLKIYAGGGGGAGHSNNGLSNVSGANGGGIIFIWANNLLGNSQSINASGGSGGSSLSDGAGGGGAGGTIILHISNYTGPVTIEANGGNGGNSNNGGNIGRCFGGGGGGSGGIIYFTGSLPAITTSVTGGAAGVESGRDVSCNPVPQSAAAGTAGQVIPDYTFTRSFSPASYCSLILPADFITFNATIVRENVQLKWEVTDPELISHFGIERKTTNGNWEFIGEKQAIDGQSVYQLTDPLTITGHHYYRVRMIRKDQSAVLSAIKAVHIKPATAFTFYPNPANTELFILRKQAATAVLKLSDLSGRTLLQEEVRSTRYRLVLPVLPAGIYLLNMDGEIKKLQIR
ncbi:MAG TPA: T9SS type A sorting domain-containing protein [Chitinophagaceae bacterium]|nr:T9SS type A sorting domain-containing protein [Chitinophagaceae bacterium]HPH31025.1 T9SS type A sorting domain-containing protein [Chitinophagaceae bacterium]HPN58333.1 T9SS type A sorting domain-containing protein [Chitinophagaceae bacterium]